jgi:hypothetical protein
MAGVGKANAATQYSQSIAKYQESVITSENPILSRMADWDPEALSPPGSADLHREEVNGNHGYITGSCWHLNWGEQAGGNNWSGISGMVLNTSNTWFPGV